MDDWIDEILDPSEVVPSSLYIALDALNSLTTLLKTAAGISFTDGDSLFYSSLTTTVDSALRQIGDYLGSSSLLRQLVGDWTAVALVNATNYFNFLMTRDRVLGLIVFKVLTTPPAATDLTIGVYKNGLLIDTLTIVAGSTGYVYKDLSHTAVSIGDMISVNVLVASGTVGLAMTMEV